MASFTQKYHHTSYPSINPRSPANSQAGRTVLVTGGSEGIGFAIAQSFVSAGAARVILLGRRKAVVEAAAQSLQDASSASPAANRATEVEGHACDISSEADVAALWEGLAARRVHVDVLVLNAAYLGHSDLGPGNMPTIRKSFEIGVLANMSLAHAFMSQPSAGDSTHTEGVRPQDRAHAGPIPRQGAYGASKAALAKLFQHLAEETPAEKIQIMSFHPGAILTPGARAAGGFDENSLPWDDAQLPGDFAVWASTPAARFLHGCHVWANWDVDELMARREEITTQSGMLKVAVHGVEYVDPATIFQKISAKASC